MGLHFSLIIQSSTFLDACTMTQCRIHLACTFKESGTAHSIRDKHNAKCNKRQICTFIEANCSLIYQ